MRTLKEVLTDAKDNNYAIAHFNFSDSTQFNAIVSVAQELSVPILVGVSEGEKKFIRIENTVALVEAARKERGVEVYLNLDHAHDVEACKQAIDMGFDSVMFDGSRLSLEENILNTQEVVKYAQGADKEVLVEAELGYIGSSSALLDDVPEGAGLEKTSPELAKEFVEKTGIDILAPSVGNLHGMFKNAPNPDLDIDRIAAIRSAIPNTFLVLHGGSGIKDEDFVAAIKAGINIIHINTEIRKAYRAGIEEGLNKDSIQVAPYKYLNYGYDKMKEVIKKRIELFMNI